MHTTNPAKGHRCDAVYSCRLSKRAWATAYLQLCEAQLQFEGPLFRSWIIRLHYVPL